MKIKNQSPETAEEIEASFNEACIKMHRIRQEIEALEDEWDSARRECDSLRGLARHRKCSQ